MKNKLKIILTTVIFAIIIFASVVYAENEITENTTNTDTNTSTTENTVTNTTNSSNTTDDEETSENNVDTNTAKTEEKKKSSNANLKNLGIKPNDFKGFKPGTTSYKAEVSNNVTQVEVYAEAQDTEAEVIITGTGKRKLEVGDNELIITVTAEDGTQKTYTIYVTRLAEEETIEDDEEEDHIEVQENQYAEGNGLASIKFENASIEPEFQTNVYEYQVKYIGEETELDIKVEPTDNTYIVQITGNENLQEGENIITILVSDKDDNNVATYQLTVNKKLVDEEAIAREKQQKKMLIIGSIVVIAIVAIVVIIIKIRKNKKEAEEYSVPFLGMNFNEENQDSNILEEKEMSKEDLRKTYLENYNNNNDYEEEQPTKKKIKSKGKRFK